MYQIRELSNSYEMSKLAIDSMIDYAVYILDKKGIILSSNSGAGNLTGFQSSEVIGTHFARFYLMEDIELKVPEEDLKIARNHGHHEIENWMSRKDGSLYWANIIINRLNDQNGKHIGYSQITRDLTGKKHNENALKMAEYAAQKELKLKSQFIADISHELRTPLGAILGFAEFLQKDNINEMDKNHYLDIILKNGKNLNRIINDVLDLSKIEAGRINIELIEFNLDEILYEVIDLFRPQCEAKSIHISYDKKEKGVHKVISDCNRLHQILNNIVSNAIKFTNKGEITLSVKLVKETPEQNCFEILIKDTGIGLSQKEINRIFHPFIQIGNSQNKMNKGSGLGLVLSRRMAEALGGDVELVSTQEGNGSTFSVKFTDYKTLKKPSKSRAINMQPHSLKSKSILIVDDSVDNLEIIKLFLNSYGGDPDIALDGKEALKKVKNKKYDVILMDIEMPNMNGFQVIKELRHRKNRTPVIALTAHALPEDRLKTKNAGFIDHVTKPIDFNYLVSSIETLH
jgi:PAS domain S-box-containing protein